MTPIYFSSRTDLVRHAADAGNVNGGAAESLADALLEIARGEGLSPWTDNWAYVLDFSELAWLCLVEDAAADAA